MRRLTLLFALSLVASFVLGADRISLKDTPSIDFLLGLGAPTTARENGTSTANAQAAIAAVVVPAPVLPNLPPYAGFFYSAFMMTADFCDASFDPDGTLVRHSWSFGDGVTSFAVNPTHTYAEAGTYTVNLTVLDNDGAYHYAETTVTVPAFY